MLELHVASAAEGGGIVGLGKAQGVPEAHGRLHAQLRLKGTGAGVEAIGRAKEAVLPKRFWV